jgi:branched-subunit amino acid transport protein
VTWPAILLLAAASHAIKALGAVVVGDREIPPPLRALLDLAPVPLLAALIVTQTLSTGGAYALDARLPAVGVAAILVWRRAPFLVIVLAAAATAALLRAT